MPGLRGPKKQISVSHSSSEVEVIALDAVVRMEGIPMLMFWNSMLEVLYPNTIGANVENAKKPKLM